MKSLSAIVKYRYHILAVVAIFGVIVLIRFIALSSTQEEIDRCKRDAILFNRTTNIINGSCYVLMDDNRWLPQSIYWYKYYAK